MSSVSTTTECLQWSTALPADQEDATKKYRNPVEWPKTPKYSVYGISVLTTLLAAYSISAYVAGVPVMVQEFNSTETVVLVGMTTFQTGFAAGLMVLAPLSEINGRKPVCRFCFCVAPLFYRAGYAPLLEQYHDFDSVTPAQPTVLIQIVQTLSSPFASSWYPTLPFGEPNPPKIVPEQRHPVLLRSGIGEIAPNSNFSNPSDPRWSFAPTPEPLSPEMRNEVVKEFKAFYHFYRRDAHREYVRNNIRLPQIDLIRSATQTERQMRNWAKPALFCNKSTTLYWMRSEQGDTSSCPSLPICAIYNAWFRQFRATNDAPSTIKSIAETHKALCNEVTLVLSQQRPGSTYENYSLRSPAKALVMILDRRHYMDEEIDEGPDFPDIWADGQTVLLVRTGEGRDLSSPISFDDIRASSPPLERDDARDLYVIRLSLPVAVSLITELEKREDLASPGEKPVDEWLCPNEEYGDDSLHVDTWAARIMEDADKKGIDKVERTWKAVRRVEARRREEEFSRLDPFLTLIGASSIWG